MYRDRFGVEFICRTLNEHCLGGFITSRGYRAAKRRPDSKRLVRDRENVELVRRLHAANYGVYGVRKMWHALNRAGVRVGRDQTARLMRLAGLKGRARGREPKTTSRPLAEDTRPDLVNRCFQVDGPGLLWVADITYVRTRQGFVYAAFVIDAFPAKSWAGRYRTVWKLRLYRYKH